jgi:hypothetical protein
MDYSKSVIYKICSRDKSITDVYIGSTTSFVRRKNSHKSTCNNETDKGYNLYVYGFIRESGGWNEWEMIQIEEYPCTSRRELEFREEQIRTELNATLNTHRCWTDGKCSIDGCENQVQTNKLCISHGGKRFKYFCKIDGCENQVVNNCVCVMHGAERIKCKIDGCDNWVVNNGICQFHGAVIKKCKIDGCKKQVINNGVCMKHGAVVKKRECSVDGCDYHVKNNGVCKRHGAVVKKCKIDGCEKNAREKGLCYRHRIKRLIS